MALEARSALLPGMQKSLEVDVGLSRLLLSHGVSAKKGETEGCSAIEGPTVFHCFTVLEGYITWIARLVAHVVPAVGGTALGAVSDEAGPRFRAATGLRAVGFWGLVCMRPLLHAEAAVGAM